MSAQWNEGAFCLPWGRDSIGTRARCHSALPFSEPSAKRLGPAPSGRGDCGERQPGVEAPGYSNVAPAGLRQQTTEASSVGGLTRLRHIDLGHGPRPRPDAPTPGLGPPRSGPAGPDHGRTVLQPGRTVLQPGRTVLQPGPPALQQELVRPRPEPAGPHRGGWPSFRAGRSHDEAARSRFRGQRAHAWAEPAFSSVRTPNSEAPVTQASAIGALASAAPASQSRRSATSGSTRIARWAGR